jgi:hypothetical protein
MSKTSKERSVFRLCCVLMKGSFCEAAALMSRYSFLFRPKIELLAKYKHNFEFVKLNLRGIVKGYSPAEIDHNFQAYTTAPAYITDIQNSLMQKKGHNLLIEFLPMNNPPAQK